MFDSEINKTSHMFPDLPPLGDNCPVMDINYMVTIRTARCPEVKEKICYRKPI